MMPKTMAPIGRMASVAVSANAIFGRDAVSGAPGKNDRAMSSMTSVRMKKSNASSVQPRKPARTALRWLVRSSRVIFPAEMTGTALMRDENTVLESVAGGGRLRLVDDEVRDGVPRVVDAD